MTLLIISFFAGILTVLTPCILPLLPVVIGTGAGSRSKTTPYIVIGSLAFSILIFTYLLKASTALISIPPYVWTYISGGILVVIGLIFAFPVLWESLPFVSKFSVGSNKLMGVGQQKKSIWGDVLVGSALGPVFSSCSPTYFIILATVLPASFLLGTVYLLSYLAGLILILVVITLTGQKMMSKLLVAADSRGRVKKIIGGVLILVGIFVITGLDKKLSTVILNSSYFNVANVEQRLLDKLQIEETILSGNKTKENTSTQTAQELEDSLPKPIMNNPVEIPKHLLKLFPKTDFSKSDPNAANILSGGPTKDGIPALTNPKYVPISESNIKGSVQAVVLTGDEQTKVFPYNILTIHEIVNETFDGQPVAITFCPLCGSVIVYDRTLPNEQITTFGVSGSLLESNMIMYDRETENLWQQSTGEVLAGSFYPAKLTILPFQLLDLDTIRETYPEALILSEDTGYRRGYSRNPYAGYDTNDRFIFDPSELNTDFPLKTIMAVFKTSDETPVAVPWLKLREAGTATYESDDSTYTLVTSDTGELTITDSAGNIYPFYFEMWFSFAIQHKGIYRLAEIK